MHSLLGDSSPPRRINFATRSAITALRRWPNRRPAARGEPGSVARAAILGLVVEATVAGSWRRVKLCGRSTCRWAFYDASPAGAAV